MEMNINIQALYSSKIKSQKFQCHTVIFRSLEAEQAREKIVCGVGRRGDGN